MPAGSRTGRVGAAAVGAAPLDPLVRGPAAPLVSAIDERLRAMLTSGVLAPGAKLNEHALAQQLRVNRSALREAARRMEQAGLLTIIPNRGVFVREVGLEDLVELFDIHAGLARSAGRLVAARISADQVAALEAGHAAMQAALGAGAVDRYRDLNAGFHQDLFGFSGSKRLAAMHSAVASELHLSGRHNLGTLHQLRASVVEHARILEGVRARDETRAARAFEQHVLAGKRRMLEAVSAVG